MGLQSFYLSLRFVFFVISICVHLNRPNILKLELMELNAVLGLPKP